MTAGPLDLSAQLRADKSNAWLQVGGQWYELGSPLGIDFGGIGSSLGPLGTLVKEPKDLTILEVVNAVEPIERIRTCPLGLAAHGTHLCPLHRRVDNAMAMVEKAFAGTTLAEVLADPSRSVPLCNFPGGKAKKKVAT